MYSMSFIVIYIRVIDKLQSFEFIYVLLVHNVKAMFGIMGAILPSKIGLQKHAVIIWVVRVPNILVERRRPQLSSLSSCFLFIYFPCFKYHRASITLESHLLILDNLESTQRDPFALQISSTSRLTPGYNRHRK
jgi:hypothetical protein